MAETCFEEHEDTLQRSKALYDAILDLYEEEVTGLVFLGLPMKMPESEKRTHLQDEIKKAQALLKLWGYA